MGQIRQILKKKKILFVFKGYTYRHFTLKTGPLKRKLDEGNIQNINVDLHIPISVTLLS
jgi:hypothetical protein